MSTTVKSAAGVVKDKTVQLNEKFHVTDTVKGVASSAGQTVGSLNEKYHVTQTVKGAAHTALDKVSSLDQKLGVSSTLQTGVDRGLSTIFGKHHLTPQQHTASQPLHPRCTPRFSNHNVQGLRNRVRAELLLLQGREGMLPLPPPRPQRRTDCRPTWSWQRERGRRARRMRMRRRRTRATRSPRQRRRRTKPVRRVLQEEQEITLFCECLYVYLLRGGPIWVQVRPALTRRRIVPTASASAGSSSSLRPARPGTPLPPHHTAPHRTTSAPRITGVPGIGWGDACVKAIAAQPVPAAHDHDPAILPAFERCSGRAAVAARSAHVRLLEERACQQRRGAWCLAVKSAPMQQTSAAEWRRARCRCAAKAQPQHARRRANADLAPAGVGVGEVDALDAREVAGAVPASDREQPVPHHRARQRAPRDLHSPAHIQGPRQTASTRFQRT